MIILFLQVFSGMDPGLLFLSDEIGHNADVWSLIKMSHP